MNKILVLAEKPSVGRDLARVLNCSKNGNGYLEGNQYIVTWALGHLVTLADPETYDEKYKVWKIEDLPMLPSRLELEVIKQTRKQYQVVKSQLSRKDVQQIVIATDAGREGELVARWILAKSGVKKPLKRLWISSVTDKAIREGFQKLQDGRKFENLYASAIARAEADWYVGLNATRALTCKFNAQLSCGRVQTPTLAMIAKREEEIRQFKPETYYGIVAQTEEFSLVWQDKQTNQSRVFDLNRNKQLLDKLQHQPATINDVHKIMKKSYSPQLYDLTELQREAHNRFGYSAKETLSIMQKLYEQHKIVTYPRTDSRFLSSDLVDTLKDRLEACSITPYTKITNQLMKKQLKPAKHFVQDSKVTDHHAIIPTEQRPLLSKLSDKERKIYDLVVRRFLAVLHDPYEYEQITVTASIGPELFVAKGKRVVNQGWKEVYDFSVESDEESEDSLKDQTLPDLQKGAQLKVVTLKQTQGETKPPKPFNEATLLTVMENPSKYMEEPDHQLKKTLVKTGGLGTVATRADIIEKLFNSFLIEKRGKDIFVTSKGKQLLDLAPQDLRSPNLTAEWEMKLEAIANGSLSKEIFINEIISYTQKIVAEIKQSQEKFRHDNLIGKKCPDCGKPMLEVKGKKGVMHVCQDRECGHRKNVSKVTNARCPNCRKKLELRGEGEGQIFVCMCGYKEKLTAFNERRKQEKTSKASKKDVAQFLRNQNKEESVNTALADALAKLGLQSKD